ncbi:eukaryotic translation initiation factor 2A isoform X1 [Prosopis cineraria]|uniref:eukaryotic translation initiation factor 2A isoform X1 n=1 Tax=Prosopis cineraria TaxID=364024 RepID=UPI00240F49C8|nr:eukaryotic translation initiation factor 2A isoform X1 [Prosopis cineraria]XP_054809391.1 eukaryotic translation initiation factor 2A isoform X1 [Prosopis cineraria]XP_054809392.1 eukaryotic translation initiation factor 2A isoform X1 [Prosopis cineraria]
MASKDPPPSLEILVRTPDNFSIWSGLPFPNAQPGVKLDKGSCLNAKFCDNGSRLLVMKSNSVITVYDCANFQEIRSFEIHYVAAAILSPCGTYLLTFQRPLAPQDKNVTLWKTETGDPVYQHSQKNMTKTTWPSIQFSSDETVACRMATNEVQFFDTGDFSKGIIYRLKVPGVAAIELSRTPGSHVAVLVPESKGVPASVQIFSCEKDSQSQPIARRNFFRCSTVQFNWNHGSSGLLVVVQSDVDKTNQSYFGESKLCYLTTDGTQETVKRDLFMMPSGHVLAWNLVFYMVLYLLLQLCLTRREDPYMSLAVVLTIQFDGTQKESVSLADEVPLFLCPLFFFKKYIHIWVKANYSMTFWPLTTGFSVLVLAGFGNLPGDMEFWDYVEAKKIRKTKAEWSVTSEWSPDGCYFMTATTAPRLQVDNGIKIFNHDGSLYFEKKFDKLFQADWKPESPNKFGDITELIKSLGTVKIEDSKRPGQGPTVTKAAYCPPHAKKAAAIQAELLGMDPTESSSMSKNALRNKKKRERQREKKAAEAIGSS